MVAFDTQAQASGGHVLMADGSVRYVTPTQFMRGFVLAGPRPESSWVQLFNGKDLTGWETFDKGTGRWKVVDGNLTCDGPCSYLFTKRDDFKDFHFRVEARLNARGNSGQYFRSRFEPGRPKGYYAQINNSDTAAGTRTGALNRVTLSGGFQNLANVPGGLVLDNAWFTQEVIAKGNHIQILVNGKKVVDHVDKDSMFKQGRLALEHMTEPTRVEFRKVEIKELPAAGLSWGKIVDPTQKCKFAGDENRLTIAMPPGYFGLRPDSTRKGARVLQQAKGDFDLQVKVEPFPRPRDTDDPVSLHPHLSAGLVCWQDNRISCVLSGRHMASPVSCRPALVWMFTIKGSPT